MKSTKPKTMDLTIALLRAEVQIDEIIEHAGALLIECDVGNGSAKLLYRQSDPHPASWWSDIVSLANVEADAPQTQTAGAAILIECDGRWFALLYGSGRHIIGESNFVDNFGLLFTLNAVDPRQLRRLTHKRIFGAGRSTEEIVMAPGSTHAFGIDIQQDILSSVAGVPIDSGFGKWVYGKETLAMKSAPVTARDIPVFLRKIVSVSNELTYKANFDWFDNVRSIEDRETIEKLDDLVVAELKRFSSNEASVAISFGSGSPPDVEARYRYSPNEHAASYDDMRLADFLGEFRDVGRLTPTMLRNRRIYIVGSTVSFSAWRCLYLEVPYDGAVCALHEGKWYRVAADFVDGLDVDFSQIPVTNISLPEYLGGDEALYNRQVSESRPDEFVLLDTSDKQVVHGGGKSKVEICDLVGMGDLVKLIHVKRWNESASVSHLVSQAAVSAELLLNDPVFRRKADEKLSDSSLGHRFGEGAFDPRKYEIVLAIIQRGGLSRPQLPLFSRLNVRNVYRRLRGYGFGVSIYSIDDNSPIEKSEGKRKTSEKKPSSKKKPSTKKTRAKEKIS